MFIKVNVTFFVQHFLNLTGLPQQYSDYPDAFETWNQISSFNSIISLVTSIVFLYIVYRLLTNEIPVSSNF